MYTVAVSFCEFSYSCNVLDILNRKILSFPWDSDGKNPWLVVVTFDKWGSIYILQYLATKNKQHFNQVRTGYKFIQTLISLFNQMIEV